MGKSNRHGGPLWIGMLLALVVVTISLFATTNTRAEAKHYVCVACGLPCDAKVFDKPGTCPDCGMALVEQGSAAAAPKQDTRKKVAILLFNGVEIIDYTGPYELFGADNFDVYTVAETKEPITTAMGMSVVPKYAFGDAPQPDILVVPGGGVRGAMNNQAVLKFVTDVTARDQHTLSVCNGAFILASAGLLDGLTATTTYGNAMRLHNQFPKVKVVGDRRYVDNGKIITAAGLSAGMDGALHVISVMNGEKEARQVALGEEYDWRPEGGYVRPSLADRMIPNIDVNKTAGDAGDWSLVSSDGDADHWNLVVRGPSKMTVAELQASFGRAVQEQARWTPAGGEAVAASSAAPSSAWTFTDMEGKPWRGTLTVEPVQGADHEFLEKVALARGK